MLSLIALLLAALPLVPADCPAWVIAGVHPGASALSLGFDTGASGTAREVTVPADRCGNDYAAIDLCIDAADRVRWIRAKVRRDGDLATRYAKTLSAQHTLLLGCEDSVDDKGRWSGDCYDVLWSDCGASLVLSEGPWILMRDEVPTFITVETKDGRTYYRNLLKFPGASMNVTCPPPPD